MVLTLWSLRPRYTQPPDLCKEYGKHIPCNASFCTFKINHGGSFTNTVSGRSHIDGLVDHFDFTDMDVFSVHKLDDMMAVLGYNVLPFHDPIHGLGWWIVTPWHRSGSHSAGKVCAYHKEINLYIEHGNTRVVPYFKSLLKVRIKEVEGNQSLEMNRVRMKRKSVGSCSKKLDLNESTDLSKLIVPYEPVINKKHLVDRESDPFRGYRDDHQPKGDVDLVDDYEVMGDVDVEYGGEKYIHDVEFFEDEYSGSKESVSEGPWSKGSRSEGNMTDDESKDEDFLMDLENIVDDVDVDMKEFLYMLMKMLKASGSGVDFTEGEDLEVIDPESFESPIVGEDNNRERMLREIRNAKSCSEGKPKAGIYILKKNEKTRIRAKCRGVVPYMSGEPWTNSRTGFKDKTVNMKEGKCPWVVLLVSEHQCVQSRTIKACNYKYIATNIVKQIESNPIIPVNALQEDLIQKFEMNMSRKKVHREKALAQKHVFGDFQKQYAILRDYGLELMQRNPGTNVKIDCHTEPNLNSDTTMFRRIYICLGPLEEGFKANLRDFIGLYGTFMKDPYPSQILTAIGVDSNNGIYPFAYALFTRFLEQLGDDLELYANSNFTFILDRKKGIFSIIAKLFPKAEHRSCLKHIYENMKRQWKDKDIKYLVWACATATTVRHFEKALKELKKFKAEAHNWLIQIPPAHWARSHFSGRAHTKILLTNLCEVLNGKIQGGRDKKIIYCLEYISVTPPNRRVRWKLPRVEVTSSCNIITVNIIETKHASSSHEK
uniref:MULE transposase domain-containing protein n=1 Tax=Lactuca sativa TaxID=4236 RepID=A0A9R1VQ29_LACSA|nr:hypothetical protein LSAT_V11C400206680 [Lactuca sativa]